MWRGRAKGAILGPLYLAPGFRHAGAGRGRGSPTPDYNIRGQAGKQVSTNRGSALCSEREIKLAKGGRARPAQSQEF